MIVRNRNKFFPELQEAIIMIAYELSQLKMMINPLRIEFLTEQVVESLRDSLTPSLFQLSKTFSIKYVLNNYGFTLSLT